MSDLHKLSLQQLAADLDQKKYSSVELTKYFLARIKAAADLNAFTEVSEDLALQQAEAADQARAKGAQGKLLGIPVALKDIILKKK